MELVAPSVGQRARVAGDHVVVGRDDHVDAGGEKADHPIADRGSPSRSWRRRGRGSRPRRRPPAGAAGERLDLQRDRHRHPRRERDVGAIDARERAARRIDVVVPRRDGQIEAAVDGERAVAGGRAAVRRAEHRRAAGEQAVEAGDRRARGRRIVDGDQHQLGVGDGDAGRRFDGDRQVGRRRDRQVADRQVGVRRDERGGGAGRQTEGVGLDAVAAVGRQRNLERAVAGGDDLVPRGDARRIVDVGAGGGLVEQQRGGAPRAGVDRRAVRHDAAADGDGGRIAVNQRPDVQRLGHRRAEAGPRLGEDESLEVKSVARLRDVERDAGGGERRAC